MSCSICLSSRLKEPVSIPCGHVYCTDCLTAHISATSPDGFTSTCPACREKFNVVRPELTCLPKKFHQYIVPSIRRLYIDVPGNDGLRKKLSASEARVRALEDDKERLMAECERHIAAAEAHCRGETSAIRNVMNLKDELAEMEHELAEATRAAQEALAAQSATKIKYDKMKRQYRSLTRTARGENVEDESSEVVEQPWHGGKRTSALVDISMDEGPVSPKRLRVIRPLPRSRHSLGASPGVLFEFPIPLRPTFDS
ncbi:tripartite motif-containing protein 26 [Favolaschia claudopus]|uniref:Tripartite motif-containing protein 26 n=1 Tax=Favolaschia claudopus TaxID=2862362 RepID=A0AAV9Z1E5_9AGAR